MAPDDRGYDLGPDTAIAEDLKTTIRQEWEGSVETESDGM
jgi:hypothetical protein